jgi:hypothetical protein
MHSRPGTSRGTQVCVLWKFTGCVRVCVARTHRREAFRSATMPSTMPCSTRAACCACAAANTFAPAFADASLAAFSSFCSQTHTHAHTHAQTHERHSNTTTQLCQWRPSEWAHGPVHRVDCKAPNSPARHRLTAAACRHGEAAVCTRRAVTAGKGRRTLSLFRTMLAVPCPPSIACRGTDCWWATGLLGHPWR